MTSKNMSLSFASKSKDREMDITTELKHNATLLRTAEAIIQSVRAERDWFKAQLLKRDAEVERLRAERDALKALVGEALDVHINLPIQSSHEDAAEYWDFRKRCEAAIVAARGET